jgi:hypothetical protein
MTLRMVMNNVRGVIELRLDIYIRMELNIS